MDRDERNPIIRARAISRLEEKKDGQTVEDLALNIGTSESSIRLVLKELETQGRIQFFAGKWTLKKTN